METLKTHGLDGSLVEPDWPALTPEEVSGVLSAFPELYGKVELLSVSPRPFSAGSVVAVGGQLVFVKRHARAVRNGEGLREEHRFMAHLRKRGAPVPTVFATPNGETALEQAEWTYEVHSVPPGVDLYGDAISWTPFRTVQHAYSAGQALAQLHLAAEGYDAPRRKARQLVAGFTIFAAKDPGRELDRYLEPRPALREYLSKRGRREEALEALGMFHVEQFPFLSHLAPLWTHNDLHPSNLFWSNRTEAAQATAVVDFGLCDRTNAVYDLAQAIERSIVEWLQLIGKPPRIAEIPVHFDHLSALLDGYESVRPLSEVEAHALAPMTALCHAEFALSETDYYVSILHSEENAYMACEAYLTAHAQWFQGQGAQLLDVLRQRAARTGRSAGVKKG